MKGFFKEHFLAFIFAFAVGIVIALPQILLMLDPAYKGIAFTGSDSEEYYNGRIQEIYDGHYSANSHDLYEYKNTPYAQPSLPEIIVAFLGKAFGLRSSQMISLGKFIFPFFLYLIFYFFVLQISKSPLLSLTAPAVIIMGSQFIFSPSNTFSFLTFQVSAIQNISPYARPIHPEVSSLIFFLWLLIFLKWMYNGKLSYFVFSAVLFSSFIYIYVYSWMLSLVFIALLFIFHLATAKKFLNFSGRWFVSLLFFSALASIPYWINYFHLIQSPWYELLQKHYGFYKSHAPVWSNLLFLDFILLFFMYWKKEKDTAFYFFLSLFSSLFIVINQQVITGMRFYPGHWHWYYATPLSIIMFLWFLGFLFFRFKEVFTRILFLCITAVSFTFGFVNHYNFYLLHKSDYVQDQGYAKVFEWLNKNTKKDDVVLTHDTLNLYLPIYTHDNSYISAWGQLYLVPEERFYDMAFIKFYLDGVNEKNIDIYFSRDRRFVRILSLGYYKMRVGECADAQCITDEDKEKIKEKYLDFYKNADIEKFLKKYKLDYVVWDPGRQPFWNIDKYKIFSFVKEISGVKIYKVL